MRHKRLDNRQRQTLLLGELLSMRLRYQAAQLRNRSHQLLQLLGVGHHGLHLFFHRACTWAPFTEIGAAEIEIERHELRSKIQGGSRVNG